MLSIRETGMRRMQGIRSTNVLEYKENNYKGAGYREHWSMRVPGYKEDGSMRVLGIRRTSIRVLGYQEDKYKEGAGV